MKNNPNCHSHNWKKKKEIFSCANSLKYYYWDRGSSAQHPILYNKCNAPALYLEWVQCPFWWWFKAYQQVWLRWFSGWGQRAKPLTLDYSTRLNVGTYCLNFLRFLSPKQKSWQALATNIKFETLQYQSNLKFLLLISTFECYSLQVSTQFWYFTTFD